MSTSHLTVATALFPMMPDRIVRNEFINCMETITKRYFSNNRTLLLLFDNDMGDVVNVLTKTYNETVLKIKVTSLKTFLNERLMYQDIYEQKDIDYVLLFRNYYYLQGSIKIAGRRFRPNSKFIVLLGIHYNINVIVHNVFEMMLHLDIFNVIAITVPPVMFSSETKQHRVVEVWPIYTYFPFSTTHCRSVSNLIIQDVWLEGNFNSATDLFPDKLKNLHGCTLALCTDDYPPYVMLQKNPEGTYHLTGNIANLIKIYAKYLNSTLRTNAPFNTSADQSSNRMLRNGSFGGLLGQVLSKKYEAYVIGAQANWFHLSYFDLIPSKDFIRTVWVVGEPTFYPEWMNLFFPFEELPWIMIAVIFLVISVCTQFFKQFVPSQKTSHVAFQFSFMYNLSILLGISVTQPSGNSRIQFIFLLWVLGSIVLNTCYQSSLFSFLTHPKKYPYIETMEDLVHSELSFGGYRHIRTLFEDFDSPIMRTLYQKFQIIDRVPFRKDLNKLKFAFVFDQTSTEYGAYFGLPLDKHGKPYVYTVPETIVYFPKMFFLRRGSPFTDLLSFVVDSCEESGLLRKWKRDIFIHKTLIVKKLYDVEDENSAIVFGLNKLTGAFALLLFGLGIGFTFFLFEIVKNRCRFLLKAKKYEITL